MRVFLCCLLLTTFITANSPQTKNTGRQDETVVGTRVSLVPPAGFTPSSQFPGYWQEAIGASIIVTELAGPFSEATAGFFKPAELAKKNMTLLNKQEITVNDQRGFLLYLKQHANGTEYRKWLLTFGNEKETVIVIATFPKELAESLSETLKNSVLTAAWNKDKQVPPTEGLNFTVHEKADLKFATRLTNMLLYTRSGIFPSKDVDNPFFIIGQSISKVTITDTEGFARSRILSTASITDTEIEELNKIAIDDLSGYEIVAKGRDVESEQPMAIYQTILFEGQSYYIMQGIISVKHKQHYLTIFKEMAGSFRRRNL